MGTDISKTEGCLWAGLQRNCLYCDRDTTYFVKMTSTRWQLTLPSQNPSLDILFMLCFRQKLHRPYPCPSISLYWSTGAGCTAPVSTASSTFLHHFHTSVRAAQLDSIFLLIVSVNGCMRVCLVYVMQWMLKDGIICVRVLKWSLLYVLYIVLYWDVWYLIPHELLNKSFWYFL